MDEDGVSVPHKIVNLNIGGVRYTTTSTVWILLLLVFISLLVIRRYYNMETIILLVY